ncbi:TPM domain-containing protein [Arcanobacterium pinnipediorum]|uniref:TPM domain-containing protein n=1 Tax=Arcanobacterium pinnipediorum TaxID=1503041 RepID=A0ABY5AGC1_9ACTO|nr:TPM domain-containing protein [Arcanobacterium pinnipediorum]USR79250.1 TPM domain-containing protein [Arcanobacterium pinnipediorum]
MKYTRVYAAACLAGLLSLFSTAAYAVEPVDVERNYEDYADVSTSVAALSNLMVEVSNGNLWVITVDDFDSMPPNLWAKQTFEKSGLGSGDGLLVISIGTSELYAYSPSGDIKELLNQATTQDVLDEFHEGNWDEGLTLFAEHVRSLRGGATLPVSQPTSSVPNILPALGVIGLGGAGVAGFAYWRKRKKLVARQADSQDLARRASTELLAADDDVRAGVSELEFARLEFGTDATAQFRETLELAQQDVAKAFGLRRLLDDDEPETPAQQEQMNTQILSLAQRARQAMRSQAQEFSQLRDLANRIGGKLTELSERTGELRSQLPLLDDKVENLKFNFPKESLVTLSAFPDQIRSLLTAVESHLDTALKAESGGEKNQAVQYARLAESVLDQAVQLVKRIDDAPQLLAAARDQLAAGIESLSADIIDARRLGGADATIQMRQKEAEEVLARATGGRQVDLLLINEQLSQAERNLDLALAGVRARDEQKRHIDSKVRRYYEQTQAKLKSLDEDVTRYREVVSADTRTLLQRAHSIFHSAQGLPVDEQIAAYISAMDYASRANRALFSDLEDYRDSDDGGGNLTDVIISGALRALVYGAFSSGSSRRGYSGGWGGGRSSGGGFGSNGGGFGKSF